MFRPVQCVLKCIALLNVELCGDRADLGRRERGPIVTGNGDISQLKL